MGLEIELDLDDEQNDENETKIPSKNDIVREIRKYVIEEYIKSFEGEQIVSIPPQHFLKAQEITIKLLGYDKAEGGDELPDEIGLILP